MKPLRLFVALTVPADIQALLAREAQRLDFGAARIRLVPRDNLHITLKFLGDTDQEHIPDLITSLEECASRHHGFDLSLGTSTSLPPHEPRTIGVSVKETPELQSLFDDIDQTLATAGLAHQERRRFRPHITLARIDGKIPNETQEHLSTLSFEEVQFSVYDITLFESTLTPSGPIYTPLTAANLL